MASTDSERLLSHKSRVMLPGRPELIPVEWLRQPKPKAAGLWQNGHMVNQPRWTVVDAKVRSELLYLRPVRLAELYGDVDFVRFRPSWGRCILADAGNYFQALLDLPVTWTPSTYWREVRPRMVEGVMVMSPDKVKSAAGFNPLEFAEFLYALARNHPQMFYSHYFADAANVIRAMLGRDKKAIFPQYVIDKVRDNPNFYAVSGPAFTLRQVTEKFEAPAGGAAGMRERLARSSEESLNPEIARLARKAGDRVTQKFREADEQRAVGKRPRVPVDDVQPRTRTREPVEEEVRPRARERVAIDEPDEVAVVPCAKTRVSLAQDDLLERKPRGRVDLGARATLPTPSLFARRRV